MQWPYTHIIARALVAFLLLASLRGLVPGMCGTLSAFNADAADGGAPVCCPTTACPAPTNGAEGYAPTPNAHAPCAFCHLVSALAPGAAAAVIERPLILAESRLWSVTHAPRDKAFSHARPSRAPPASFSLLS